MSENSNPVNEALRLPLADRFDLELRAALNAAEDTGTVAVAFIDLDSFGEINERFGMEAGDRVLIQTGEHLKKRLPPNAGLYRYGGDQFAVLFTQGYEREEAFLLIEEIRRSCEVKLPNGEAITLSAGISASPEDGARAEELVRRADGAMFRAKAAGRNRVCLAREEKMVTKTSHYTADQLQRLNKVSKREGIGEAILLREALDALLKKYDV